MRTTHFFATDIAQKYGIACAVILQNIAYWIEHNRANDTNFYDGDHWTYNSVRAFGELFPYFTSRQINYAIQKLKEEGLIKTGNYNKSAYDRTVWYALTEKGKSILQNCQMEETKLENGFNTVVKPIPDINTDDKSILKNTNTVTSFDIEAPEKKKTDYQMIVDMYNSICTSFPTVRSISNARKKAIGARLKIYTVDDFRTVFENAQSSSFLKGQNPKNWSADFDWMLKDANMAKVLDGKYRDKKKVSVPQQICQSPEEDDLAGIF